MVQHSTMMEVHREQAATPPNLHTGSPSTCVLFPEAARWPQLLGRFMVKANKA